PETHPDLRPGRGARLGWRSNDPGPATAALLWPEVQRVMELVERAYPLSPLSARYVAWPQAATPCPSPLAPRQVLRPRRGAPYRR
ncbi:MAG TPA: hypothetical protein VFE42_17105, partial [Chloroflexota bacterium]|nr:hypothetical protein [Chloroflexota bacterium]